MLIISSQLLQTEALPEPIKDYALGVGSSQNQSAGSSLEAPSKQLSPSNNSHAPPSQDNASAPSTGPADPSQPNHAPKTIASTTANPHVSSLLASPAIPSFVKTAPHLNLIQALNLRSITPNMPLLMVGDSSGAATGGDTPAGNSSTTMCNSPDGSKTFPIAQFDPSQSTCSIYTGKEVCCNGEALQLVTEVMKTLFDTAPDGCKQAMEKTLCGHFCDSAPLKVKQPCMGSQKLLCDECNSYIVPDTNQMPYGHKDECKQDDLPSEDCLDIIPQLPIVLLRTTSWGLRHVPGTGLIALLLSTSMLFATMS